MYHKLYMYFKNRTFYFTIDEVHLITTINMKKSLFHIHFLSSFHSSFSSNFLPSFSFAFSGATFSLLSLFLHSSSFTFSASFLLLFIFSAFCLFPPQFEASKCFSRFVFFYLSLILSSSCIRDAESSICLLETNLPNGVGESRSWITKRFSFFSYPILLRLSLIITSFLFSTIFGMLANN